MYYAFSPSMQLFKTLHARQVPAFIPRGSVHDARSYAAVAAGMAARPRTTRSSWLTVWPEAVSCVHNPAPLLLCTA